ncbi:hypothetical protein LN650_01810 [Klebsiella pneumoniae subsp. pneumoniae]|nr:hypothetical protein [Klebsiella pneumoniae subsp. pneumoniae]
MIAGTANRSIAGQGLDRLRSSGPLFPRLLGKPPAANQKKDQCQPSFPTSTFWRKKSDAAVARRQPLFTSAAT